MSCLFQGHFKKEGDFLNHANQTNFRQFSKIALNVVPRLFHVHFVMCGNPLRQFLCRLTVFELVPQVLTDRIEGVNGIQISHTPANWNNYRSPATWRQTMDVFRVWRTCVVFTDEGRSLGPGSSGRGLGIDVASRMKHALSLCGRYGVAYQYPPSTKYLTYKAG